MKDQYKRGGIMPIRFKFWVIILGIALLFTWTSPVIGSSIDQLEKLANSDLIPEMRTAASKALARKYVNEKFPSNELVRIAGAAGTDQLRNAATIALSRRYKDAKRVGSLKKALKKVNRLEEKVKAGESTVVRKAASSALSFYYVAFNVNNVKGYSMSELEEIAITGNKKGLKEAAATALEFVYPNHYSAEKLINLIKTSSHESIKQGAAGALAIRYFSKMPPDPDIQELRRIASNEAKNRWLREASGRAFGELASGKVDSKELKELALRGNTEEIRSGAASAWAENLIESGKTKEELLRMACAVTGSASPAYRSAVVSALADRMFKSTGKVLGG
ncbi:MAG: hypothetical protein ABEJ25_06030 [Candidatus Bipolaricaulia bacterium]